MNTMSCIIFVDASHDVYDINYDVTKVFMVTDLATIGIPNPPLLKFPPLSSNEYSNLQNI